MSLTLIQQPDPTCLSADPVPLVIQTSNQFSSAGVPAIYDLVFGALPSVGNSFSLYWNNQAIEVPFEFVASADNSGEQISAPAQGALLSEYLTQVVLPAFASNALLSTNYTITQVSGTTIRFTARETGTAFNMQLGIGGGTFSLTTLTAGTNRTLRPNYKLVAYVFAKRKSEVSYKSVPLELPPGVDNRSIFDLSYVLDGDWLESPLPAFGVNAPSSFNDSVGMFYIRYAEQFGEPSKTKKLFDTNVHHFLIGGLSENFRRTKNFHSHFVDGQRFLNTLPSICRFRANGLQHLWWYNNSHEYTTAKVYARIKTDSGWETAQQLFALSGLTDQTLWQIPIRLSAIEAIHQTQDSILGFEIWVGSNSDPDTTYTSTQYFEVDNKPVADELQLLYANSMGCFETFHVLGVIRRPVEVNHEMAEKVRDPQAVIARRTSLRVDVDDPLEVSTDLLSSEEAEQVAQLLASESVYVIEADHYRPVRITKGTALLKESQVDETYSVKFQIMSDIKDRYL